MSETSSRGEGSQGVLESAWHAKICSSGCGVVLCSVACNEICVVKVVHVVLCSVETCIWWHAKICGVVTCVFCSVVLCGMQKALLKEYILYCMVMTHASGGMRRFAV